MTLSLSWPLVNRLGLRHWVNKYVRGVLRLALSLRDVGASYPLVIIAANVSSTFARSFVRPLRRANLTLVHVPIVPPPPRYATTRHVGTWTKLHAFGLDTYRRVLLLDVDVIVRRSIDHLLTTEAIRPPAATSEGLPPARDGSILPFNTGVLLLRPSRVELARMLETMRVLPSYDGSEQGFLASYLSRVSRTPWSELPRRYNLFQCPQADEVADAFVWHLTPSFHGALSDGTVRDVIRELDARVDTMMRA